MVATLSFHRLNELALGRGFQVMGATGADDLAEALPGLTAWQSNGFAGDMKFMQRPAEMLTAVRNLLPSATSCVTVSVRYSAAPRAECPTGFGRVARYAWGGDYHGLMRQRLNMLVEDVSKELGTAIEARCFSDAVPLLERALSARAGVGFQGKNTLIITPGQGSFAFLGEILWNLELTDVPQAAPKGRCGTCQKCLDNCPTSAFDRAGVLDARKCIAYITIEKRGPLEEWERRAMGDWIFGCDICQEVCPFNQRPIRKSPEAAWPEFEKERGAGAFLNLAELIGLKSPSDFRKRFRDTALERSGWRGLKRNALCVAANTGAFELMPQIETIAREEADPVLRATAVWSFNVLDHMSRSDKSRRLLRILDSARKDPDPYVSNEAELCLIKSASKT
jgi:epoxyqueuosine reductase